MTTSIDLVELDADFVDYTVRWLDSFGKFIGCEQREKLKANVEEYLSFSLDQATESTKLTEKPLTTQEPS